eukprot:NODE_12113_length_287_cov_18.231092_g11200_i0.p2 GENE.NODE_12113_length_287_cov_18.231092_g11200_i0~~NODE_12113_length_287_cov_18.231092_g11200_i0.p2  ORF type:complete len:76 (+),score=18.92 NODE_12113_length_287_cov_18.231092_g11200_i0:23-229(+)
MGMYSQSGDTGSKTAVYDPPPAYESDRHKRARDDEPQREHKRRSPRKAGAAPVHHVIHRSDRRERERQ